MTFFDSMRLDGAAAFVTGASRGLGRAAALALAEAGADVALAATGAEGLEETAEGVRAMGRRASLHAFDVADPGAARAAVDEAARALGRLDIAVNGAGVCPRVPPLETPDGVVRRIFEVNVFGTLAVCQAAVPHMREPGVQRAGGGRIVNVGSVAGMRGRTDAAVYAASKAAVHNLTQSLALDWAPMGIRVNAIAPGQFDTDMGQPTVGDPKALEAFLQHVPLRRVARPGEMGALVVYLCARASAFMTGSVIVLDGGLSLP